jgi:hypothetical protein
MSGVQILARTRARARTHTHTQTHTHTHTEQEDEPVEGSELKGLRSMQTALLMPKGLVNASEIS